MKKNVSQSSIERLPIYYRAFKGAQRGEKVIISSEEIGRALGITAEQIRKDLALFGQFGRKGIGYNVNDLIKEIGQILGLNREWNIAIVGVGHLGSALANYQNFSEMGYKVSALFDTDERIIGSYVNKVKVMSAHEINRVVKGRGIQIGIITVPAGAAQRVADELSGAGVKGIWNFAPVRISVPERVHIVNKDLSVDLSTLSYHITNSLT